MKVKFTPTYGKNKLEIPTIKKTYAGEGRITSAKKNLFDKKVTIYNDIPSDGVNLRRFDRFVIDRCLIYNQLSESADGTINKLVNTQNVITKDVDHYKTPYEYSFLAEDERESFYTVQPNDFVVFGEVDDVVTTSQEWTALQKKYKNNGFSVTGVNASIHGMDVDNVQITHA